MLTIHCSFFTGKNSLAAKSFLAAYGALFARQVGLCFSESEPHERTDLITNVIRGEDQIFTDIDLGVELYFGIQANPPCTTSMSADQLYEQVLTGIPGSLMRKIGIKIAYVSGIHGAERNQVVRIP